MSHSVSEFAAHLSLNIDPYEEIARLCLEWLDLTWSGGMLLPGKDLWMTTLIRLSGQHDCIVFAQMAFWQCCLLFDKSCAYMLLSSASGATDLWFNRLTVVCSDLWSYTLPLQCMWSPVHVCHYVLWNSARCLRTHAKSQSCSVFDQTLIKVLASSMP